MKKRRPGKRASKPSGVYAGPSRLLDASPHRSVTFVTEGESFDVSFSKDIHGALTIRKTFGGSLIIYPHVSNEIAVKGEED